MNDFFTPSFFDIVTIISAGTALIVSLSTSKKSSSSESYSDLDHLYMDVLKIGMEHPEFRDPEKTKNYKQSFKDKEQLMAYETYAYIVWNVCETVYDRTKNDKTNRKTWYPIIEAEKKLHLSWLLNEENHHKFKSGFREFCNSKQL
ncbi:MAG: hypothetical protein KGI08_06210 [Thaumarchaeota archaeon]|nr:hypothetical protein [Nitrososphaerota archaeon]